MRVVRDYCPTAFPTVDRLGTTHAARRAAIAAPAASALPTSLPAVAATVCVATFVARSSVLAYIGNDLLTRYLAYGAVGALILSSSYLTLGGIGRINHWGLLLIAATGASLWNCERFDFALPRWLGWVVLLWALGPVNSSPTARDFRRHMLHVADRAFLGITVLSALWWLAGRPNLGRGDFTGVMWHSMVLGPIAAYAAILALQRALTRGSPAWLVTYAVAGGVVLLASSRAALAAMAAGSLVVIALRAKKQPLVAAIVLASASALVVAPQSSLSLLAHVVPNEFTRGLADKNWNNSREAHWEARWEEFMSFPLRGVGFASAWEGTVGVDEETGAVEAGSSFLAVLSMTGCVGGVALAALLLATAWRVTTRWRAMAERQRVEICSIAAFWIVHLGAEGYIYAVGSLLGVTFWLWMGWLHDQLVIIPPTIPGGQR